MDKDYIANKQGGGDLPMTRVAASEALTQTPKFVSKLMPGVRRLVELNQD
jgi:hypothetical protein